MKYNSGIVIKDSIKISMHHIGWTDIINADHWVVAKQSEPSDYTSSVWNSSKFRHIEYVDRKETIILCMVCEVARPWDQLHKRSDFSSWTSPSLSVVAIIHEKNILADSIYFLYRRKQGLSLTCYLRGLDCTQNQYQKNIMFKQTGRLSNACVFQTWQ